MPREQYPGDIMWVDGLENRHDLNVLLVRALEREYVTIAGVFRSSGGVSLQDR